MIKKVIFFNIIFSLYLYSIIYSQNQYYDFSVAVIRYSGGGDWYSYQTSMKNLLRYVKEDLKLNTPEREKVLRLTDPELYRYPFIFITGHGNIRFSEREIQILRRYLLAGGFLWADDDYGMDKSFRREMKRVFPELDFIKLPSNHKIFNCFYRLKGLPKIHKHNGKPPEALALKYNGRILVLYTYESNISDGLDDPEIHNDPEYKRILAKKMAINIVYYFFYYNYPNKYIDFSIK